MHKLFVKNNPTKTDQVLKMTRKIILNGFRNQIDILVFIKNNENRAFNQRAVTNTMRTVSVMYRA